MDSKVRVASRYLNAASKLDVEGAFREVQEKSDREIESDTAHKWAARAIACFQLHQSTGELRWFLRGNDYRHEAIEHAALVEDGGATMLALIAEVDRFRGA